MRKILLGIAHISAISLVFLILISAAPSVNAPPSPPTTGGDIDSTKDKLKRTNMFPVMQEDFDDPGANDIEVNIVTEGRTKINGWRVSIPAFEIVDSIGTPGGSIVTVVGRGTNIKKHDAIRIDIDLHLNYVTDAVKIWYCWTLDGHAPPNTTKGHDGYWWIYYKWRYASIVSPKKNCTYAFNFTNVDNATTVTLTNVTFLPTMTFYDDLTAIVFSPPYYNVTIPPLQSWLINVSTTSPLFGGHIYFSYGETFSGGDNQTDLQAWTDVPLEAQPTITPLTTYPTVYISKGKMVVPLGGGVLAQMTFDVNVTRNDGAGLVAAIVSLARYNLTALTDYRNRQNSSATGYDMTGVPWPNGGWVYIESLGDPANAWRLLGAQSPVYPSQMIIATYGGTSTTVTLTWYEDGVVSTLPANATWSIGAIVGIAPSAGALYNDTDLSNNEVILNPDIYSCTALTETTEIAHGSTTYMKYYTITGDINGDGRVDILDAIALSNSFLKRQGQAGFNPAADINQDGVVNILDAIQLANNFNKQLGFL